MSNVTPLPRQPRAPQSRPLTFRGAYGQPGGERRSLLSYHQHGPARPMLPVRWGAAGFFMLHCSHFAPLAPPPARPVLVLP